MRADSKGIKSGDSVRAKAENLCKHGLVQELRVPLGPLTGEKSASSKSEVLLEPIGTRSGGMDISVGVLLRCGKPPRGIFLIQAHFQSSVISTGKVMS